MSKFLDPSARSVSSIDDVTKKIPIEEKSPNNRRRHLLIYSIVGGVVVLALALGLGLGLGLKTHEKAEVVYPSKSYSLVESYGGTDFFDKFDYWSAADPTDGFVLYQLRANANYENYTYASNSSAIIRSATTATETGINSVRIQSTLNYTQGLFIVDVAHMPTGCGIWPAFWTCDTSNWPDNGEIDILEGVNLQISNQMTLHTSSGCSMKNVKRNETGTVLKTQCASEESSDGCGVNDTTHADLSFGAGFNSNGGGVYAMDWRSNGIRVWFFERNSIPADLTALSEDSTTPTMDDWGIPVAEFSDASCNIDSHFSNHQIIFDTTFCGDWAGEASTWNASSCYNADTAPTCVKYMETNPTDLQNAYWTINGLWVFQANGTGASVVGAEYATTTTTSSAALTSSTAVA